MSFESEGGMGFSNQDFFQLTLDMVKEASLE